MSQLHHEEENHVGERSNQPEDEIIQKRSYNHQWRCDKEHKFPSPQGIQGDQTTQALDRWEGEAETVDELQTQGITNVWISS